MKLQTKICYQSTEEIHTAWLIGRQGRAEVQLTVFAVYACKNQVSLTFPIFAAGMNGRIWIE